MLCACFCKKRGCRQSDERQGTAKLLGVEHGPVPEVGEGGETKRGSVFVKRPEIRLLKTPLLQFSLAWSRCRIERRRAGPGATTGPPL